MAPKPLLEGSPERLLALLAGRSAEPETLLRRLRESTCAGRVPAFTIALRHMVGVDLPEDRAEALIVDMLTHRSEMGRRLGRDPGFRVAAADYLDHHFPRIAASVAGEVLQALEALDTDPLTGLRTGARLRADLDRELERRRRDHRPVSVVVVEIDDFESIVEAEGEECGDIVVRRVAQVIRRFTRDTDASGRLAAQRFGVVAPVTDSSGLLAIGARIRSRVAESFDDARDYVGLPAVTLSLGGSSCPGDGHRAGALLARAGEALFLAKELGGDRLMTHSRLGGSGGWA